MFCRSLYYLRTNFYTAWFTLHVFTGGLQKYLDPKFIWESWVLDKPIRKIVFHQLNI